VGCGGRTRGSATRSPPSASPPPAPAARRPSEPRSRRGPVHNELRGAGGQPTEAPAPAVLGRAGRHTGCRRSAPP
jgi:hypothetical protein